MTSTTFFYPETVFNKCATSNIVLSLVSQERKSSVLEDPFETPGFVVFPSLDGNDRQLYGKDASCSELWGLYKNHYYGEVDGDTDWELLRVPAPGDIMVITASRPTNAGLLHHQQHHYRVKSRLEKFLRSVSFVHNHNQNPNASHTVALNRFSAVETDHIFSSFGKEPRFLASRHEAVLPAMHHRRLKKAHASSQYVIVKDMRVPDVQWDPFQAPSVTADKYGYLLSIRKRHFHKSAHGDSIPTVQLDAVPDQDNYKHHLNWATSENPDGVPIVRESFDQLSCGSCWAFAAAGSLEASTARRAAFIAYDTFLSLHRKTKKNGNQTVQKEAIAMAQRVEQRSMHVLNLSVQQLLDCDSAADQGCVGGNPLLAFNYIHENGLVSWDEYPYRAEAGTCRVNATKKPIATVRSWGIIQADHEKHMELALRYIGPIAVGINGNVPEFLAYKGGIFDSPGCKQKANHALLVVGYGEELDASTGTLARYWIARNSWGKGWGEDGGYVRIKRRNGHFGVPGVCGIARNPSVALGGVLLRHTAYVFNESGLGYKLNGFQAEHFCTDMGFNANASNVCFVIATWTENHRALSLGFIGVFCGLVLIWPLSLDVRRRRKYRELQRKRREERQRQSSRTELPVESTPLLANETPAAVD